MVAKDSGLSPKTSHLFDAIIFVNSKGNYEVAKGNNSVSINTIPEFQMQLFIEGKSLDDMPRFRLRNGGLGPIKLYTESNGDLIGISGYDDFDPSN